MLHILDLKRTVEFIPEGQGGQPTIFLIGVLPNRLISHIEKSTQKFKIDTKTGDVSDMDIDVDGRLYLFAKFGLRGWSNLMNGTGEVVYKPQSYEMAGTKYEGAEEYVLDALPRSLLYQIAKRVMSECKLSGEEEKNSFSP